MIIIKISEFLEFRYICYINIAINIKKTYKTGGRSNPRLTCGYSCLNKEKYFNCCKAPAQKIYVNTKNAILKHLV